MTESEVQMKAFVIYTKLLDKGYLSLNHEIMADYNSEEKVRLCIHRLAKAQGTDVFEKGDHLHLITLPEGSVFATSYSHALQNYKEKIDIIDWYIIAFIQAVFCWEIDNDYSHKMNLEREGVSYLQLEEMVTKLFSDWYRINQENKDRFTEEFKIAIRRINDRWENMSIKKPKTKYSLSSRLGLINKAMLLFKEGNLVYISENHKTACIVYPNTILFERLEHVFHDLDRYQTIKSLINDSLEDYSLELKDSLNDNTDEREDTA